MTQSLPKQSTKSVKESGCLKVRLKALDSTLIDWPDSPNLPMKGFFSILSPDVQERLLLIQPPIVVESESGRYIALNNRPSIGMFQSDTKSGKPRKIRCLVIEDAVWDRETWRLFAECGVDLLLGGLSSKDKREARQRLKTNAVLRHIVRTPPAKSRIQRMTQDKHREE